MEEKAFWDTLVVEDILQFNFRESPGDNWLSMVDAPDNLSLRDALDVMADFKIRSLPVFVADETEQEEVEESLDDSRPKDYRAIVSVMDVLCWMAWKTEQQNSSKVCLGDLIGITEESRDLWKFDSTVPFRELFGPVAKGVHSMLIFSKRNNKNVPYVLSQSDIVRFFHENVDKFDSKKLNASLKDSGILSLGRPVLTMKSTENPRTGYRRMWQEQISALAVVDGDGVLVGTLSSSDLRIASTDEFEQQLDTLSVMEFLKVHGASGSKKQICVTSETCLADALALPVKHGIHRLWVVDENSRPTHVITLSDLICNVTSTGVAVL